MALAAGVPVRTLQEFLSLHRWDDEAVSRRTRELVRSRHPSDDAIAVIDETSYAKVGKKTAGVKRQYCGSTGKIDNCVVSVHLGYVADEFHGRRAVLARGLGRGTPNGAARPVFLVKPCIARSGGSPSASWSAR